MTRSRPPRKVTYFEPCRATPSSSRRSKSAAASAARCASIVESWIPARTMAAPVRVASNAVCTSSFRVGSRASCFMMTSRSFSIA